MRVLLGLCLCVFGCVNEVNYCGAPGADGGVGDMSGYHDQDGEWHDESGPSIFKEGAKFQGNAQLVLQPAAAPTAGVWNNIWPHVMDTPARASAQTLIDISTKDGEPHVVTLSLGFVGRAPVGELVNPAVEVVGVLDVGIGGLSFQAEVDFVQGTQFSLAASRLQLHAIYWRVYGNPVVAIGAPVPTVQVGASLSTGVIAHGRQPQRTLTRRNGPAAGNNDAWFIPTFAKSLRVVCVPANLQLYEQFWSNAFQLTDYQTVAYPSADLPIPNGSDTFVVANPNLQGRPDHYSLIWELAL